MTVGPGGSAPRRLAPRLFASGLLAPAVAATLFFAPPPLLARVELWVQDWVVQSRAPAHRAGNPVVVAIDEASLVALGRWPWPRARLADLLARIQAQGPAAVGLDMMFPEADSVAGDAALSDALGRGPYVLGYAFGFGPPERPPDPACVLHPLRVAGLDHTDAALPPALFRAARVTCNRPALAAAAGSSGFLNVAPDPDGVVRRIPLLLEHGGRAFPSFALAALQRARGHRAVLLVTDHGRVRALVVDDQEVPLDGRGHLRLRFRTTRPGFDQVSAADVAGGRLPDGVLRDRIVLVGATALGIRESVTTAAATGVPGVEVHATALDQLLRRDFVRRPDAAVAAELVLVLGAGLGSAALLAWRPSVPAGLMIAACGAALWPGAVWLAGAGGTLVSPLFPTLTLAANLVALVAARALVERRRARRGAVHLALARQLMFSLLTSLTEIRDTETGGHLLRTQRYVRVLCERLAAHPRFRTRLDPTTIETLTRLAPIHDIGKVGIPDRILRKAGMLGPAERAVMQWHPARGRDAIEKAQERVGIHDDAVLQIAKDIVYSHHERWDGSGYPEGLVGDAIPLAGRIVAVVDVYDALVSRRVYKEPIPHAEAVLMIASGRGSHFDPDVVDAFLAVEREWSEIHREIGDHDPDVAARLST